MNYKKNFVNFFSIILIFVVTAIWSSSLLTEWGTDYGGYYSGSFFLNNEYRLYNEYFEHKGPLYYLFLKGVGLLIGWGHIQAYFSLFLSVFIFFIVIFYILLKERLSPILILFGVCISLLLLYGQNTNASISFFQGSLTVASFYLLLKHNNETILLLSFTLFALSVLTRIDSIAYLPIYLLVALYKDGRMNFLRFTQRLIGFMLIAFILFKSISHALNFNFSDFYIHNIIFNSWYKTDSIVSQINRPTHYTILMSSLIIVPIILLRNKIEEYLYFLKIRLPNFFKQTKLTRAELQALICIAIFIISVSIWIFSASDKDYYLLLISIPIVFLIIANLSYVNDTKIIYAYLILSIYPLTLMIQNPLKNIVINPSCLSSPYCNQSTISHYSESIDFLAGLSKDEVNIIGGRGWTYLFSSKRPARTINDWWLYTRSQPFKTEKLIEQHNNLLTGKSGEFFLIDNVLLRDVNSKSELFHEILSKSVLVEKQKNYSIFKLTN